MNLEAITWGIYNIASWITKIIFLNLLWVVFSLAGLIVFGFFPATAAMFSVTRKWVTQNGDIPIFRTFMETFKKSFLQMNIIGSVLLILGVFLYIDLRFFQTAESLVLSLFAYIILFSIFIYYAVVLYIFPIFVHYDFKTMEYIKRSIVMALGKPIHTIMMIVGSYLVYMLISMIPLLMIMASGSLMSIVLTWIACKSFPRSEMAMKVTE